MLEPAPTFVRLVGDFVAIDLTPDVLNNVVKQMLVTLFQALLATTLGGFLAIPFSFLAARNLTGANPLSLVIYYAARSMFNILRSIEALLYVAIFLIWVGVGPFAGMLALAVTTFGLIGKLFSEAIENIDAGPMEAIAATGDASANHRLRDSAADHSTLRLVLDLSMGHQCAYLDHCWVCRRWRCRLVAQ
jgi:ABC-type phosphate/phosphonate transport system permease subunit